MYIRFCCNRVTNLIQSKTMENSTWDSRNMPLWISLSLRNCNLNFSFPQLGDTPSLASSRNRCALRTIRRRLQLCSLSEQLRTSRSIAVTKLTSIYWSLSILRSCYADIFTRARFSLRATRLLVFIFITPLAFSFIFKVENLRYGATRNGVKFKVVLKR